MQAWLGESRDVGYSYSVHEYIFYKAHRYRYWVLSTFDCLQYVEIIG